VAASASGKTAENVRVVPDRAAGQTRAGVAQSEAQEQAPSTRPAEALGGLRPHPLPTGRPGEARYGGEIAVPVMGPEGLTPEPRAPHGTGSAVVARERSALQQGTGAGSAAAVAAASPDRSNPVVGRVARVDRREHELAIDAGAATTQVKVAPDAKITVDGRSASLDDIPPGAEVRAALDRSGDEPQATTVVVTRPRAGKS
jgi:hypothetical protein